MKKFIYHLQASETKWDAYNACVVCATSEDTAKLIHPNHPDDVGDDIDWDDDTWVSSPDEIIVTLLGKAEKSLEIGLICSSYNAG
jgi:hypothetical protein